MQTDKRTITHLRNKSLNGQWLFLDIEI